jgi:hypothetical protein
MVPPTIMTADIKKNPVCGSKAPPEIDRVSFCDNSTIEVVIFDMCLRPVKVLM